MTGRIQEGGCACGAIGFEISAEPVFSVHCHCTDCQKTTGAEMATVAVVPKEGFRLTRGEPIAYDTTGDSGKKVHRNFCGVCGSTLFSIGESSPELVFVNSGSLKDASSLQPAMHIFTRSAQPWARIPSDVPSFAALPPD